MEDQSKPDYPERLYQQPDFEMLFRYFPQESFQQFQEDFRSYFPGRKLPDPVMIITPDRKIREDFWKALKNPYRSALIQNPNKTLVWKADFEPRPLNKKDLTKILNSKDYSAELFAIYWWLTIIIVPDYIDPLRIEPDSEETDRPFHTYNSLETIPGKQLDFAYQKNLKNLIDGWKRQLKEPLVVSKVEKANLRKKLEWIEPHHKNFKSRLTKERRIRKEVCKRINEFLTKENVCKSPTGIQLIGAFLVFSSGLTFRRKVNGIYLKFDKDFDENFKGLLT